MNKLLDPTKLSTNVGEQHHPQLVTFDNLQLVLFLV
jgi:hypothetical protein